MVWKVFWDTPRGDGMLPPSFASGAMRSDLDRLFYIEGALTMFTAIVAVFVLPDFPSTSHRWLSPIEVRLAEKRMEEDAGVGDEKQTEVKSQWQSLVDALTDWKVIYMTLKYVILHTPRERV
jgi:sugar phosphate permease